MVDSELTGKECKIVILDDDPTGTQTVSDVGVILQPNASAFRQFMEGIEPLVFVLTNTRAMPESKAVEFLRSIKEGMEREAQRCGKNVIFHLRGDSTLRGHIFAEMDVFATDLSVGLFVPAFPECGRVTLGGVHYLDIGGERRPVVDTEFARDPVFGYKSKHLMDWVREVGNKWEGIHVSLEELRKQGPKAIASQLEHAPPHCVVIPDAENEQDLHTIAEGLLLAEQSNKAIIVRSASSFVKIRCNLKSKQLVVFENKKPEAILVVCGSHTAASTVQLNAFLEHFGVTPVVIPTGQLFDKGISSVVPELQEAIARDIKNRGIAVLISERIRNEEHGDLKDGAQVMEAITATVQAVSKLCDAVVAKGGITSAQVATDGLLASYARVSGQLEAGVSLWQLTVPNTSRPLPYVVLPGNVGDEQTMIHAVQYLGLSINKEETK
jgi:uncharacterized protein YgbK (DUF1537 family)